MQYGKRQYSPILLKSKILIKLLYYLEDFLYTVKPGIVILKEECYDKKRLES